MGQPVQYYLLKWEMADSINVVKDGKVRYRGLSKGDLVEYPDLLKRFEQLKPLDLELQFGFSITPNQEYAKNLRSAGNADNNSYFYRNMMGYTYQATGSRTLRRTPDLMIARSGETGDNLTPHSPKDWQSFVDFNDEALSSDVNANQRSRNTFIAAETITFSGLKIKHISLPELEINAIYDEYLKRQEEPKESEGSEDREEGESEEDEEFWSLEDSDTEAEADEDEWSLDDTYDESHTVAQQTAEDDYWQLPDVSAKPGEVRYRDGKQGVMSTDGKTELVPFRN